MLTCNAVCFGHVYPLTRAIVVTTQTQRLELATVMHGRKIDAQTRRRSSQITRQARAGREVAHLAIVLGIKTVKVYIQTEFDLSTERPLADFSAHLAADAQEAGDVEEGGDAPDESTAWSETVGCASVGSCG